MKEEILPLNLLRFFAALCVLGVHKFTTLIDIGYLPRFLDFLIPLSTYGYLGVNLFFLISGFVITLSSEGRTAGQFISARFIRLFPIFWVCVSITTVFTIFLGNNEHISFKEYLANLTMTPELYGYRYIDGSYWTLWIELRFYMAIAALLIIGSFLKISLQKVALFLTIIIFYFSLFFNPYSISFIEGVMYNILYYFGSEYAQYFIAGILFYGIYRDKKQYVNYVAIFLCYIAACFHALDQSYSSDDPRIVLLIVTLFFASFLLISFKYLTNSSLAIFGKNYRRNIVILGASTYSLYLLHSKIIAIFIDVFTTYAMPKYLGLFFLAFIVISLVMIVNDLDKYLRKKWYSSEIIKNMITRVKFPFIRKIL